MHAAESDKPERGLDRVARVANQVGAVALLGVVAVQTWQVFARYVMNDSPSWTEPMAALLLCTAMSLGAAAMVRRDAHFGFVIARDAAPPKLRRVLRAAVDLGTLGIGLVCGGFGLQLLIDGWSVAQAGSGLPQSLPYLPVVAGGALIAVFAAAALIAHTVRGEP
jgi:TRAP-type C4-dicarboxylate transport system permease small subunit